MYYDRYGNAVDVEVETWADFFMTVLTACGWIILALLVFRMVLSMIVITPGKHAKIIETFGKPAENVRMPGLSIKLPWPISHVVASVNLQQQELAADVSIKTKDNSFMGLPVKVQYRVSESKNAAVQAHYELKNPEQQIASYVLNSVRQSAAGIDMIDLYQNRDDIERQVRTALQERFAQFGFVIENVLIDEPQPSPEVRAAFNHVIASQRAKEAATNEAEAARIKLIGVAEAEKASKKLQGEGMANMRAAIAHGIEESMKALTSAGMSHEQALSLLMDTNRLDTIGVAAVHGNLIIVDMPNGGQMANNIAAVKAASK